MIHAAADRNSLIEAIEETIEPDSWFDSDMATISLVMGNKLSIYQTPEVHQKIRKFIESIPIEIPPESTVDIPVEDFLQEKHQLIRDKRRLEMDIARSEARQRAIEEQITRISHQTASRVEEDTVTAGLDRILENQNQQLAQLKLGVERGQISPKELADAEEKIFRTKIELAQRQEQLIKSRGGDQLARYNAGLADIMIELAEKTAEIMVIDKQLNQTESQFATATAIDSRIEKIRMAKEALDRAQNRVNELNMHIADMQPPTVAVIGVD